MNIMESEISLIPPKRQIVLMISQSCNLNCRYCYESKKSSELMPVSIAKYILEEELKKIPNDMNTKSLEIAYMGGEPLMNFDLIRDVSEWLWTKEIPVPYELTVRTNGTLLNDDMKKWFRLNKSKIDVGLSMDGLSDMNRLNRKEYSVDWQFFHENWPARRIKVVLFRDSVHFLAKTVREMNAAGLPFEAVIGEGFEWTPESADILERQLIELIPEYLAHPEEAVSCGLFSFRIGDFFPAYPIRRIPVCGNANNIIGYDADGSPCICHVCSTVVLGYEKARWAWNNLRGMGNIQFDPYCTACPVHKNCKNCLGENLRLCGDVRRSAARTTICNAIRAKARACSFFFLKQLELLISKNILLSKEDQKNAERALKILEGIPSFTGTR